MMIIHDNTRFTAQSARSGAPIFFIEEDCWVACQLVVARCWKTGVLSERLCRARCSLARPTRCQHVLIVEDHGRPFLSCDCRWLQATNEWGNFHLKQPFGIFSANGGRLASAQQAGYQSTLSGIDWQIVESSRAGLGYGLRAADRRGSVVLATGACWLCARPAWNTIPASWWCRAVWTGCKKLR